MAKQSQDSNNVGRRVDELVEGLDLAGTATDAAAAVAEQVAALGREGVAHLARGALAQTGARREKAAALLGCLAGQAARWASRAIERHVETRPLNPTEHTWVMALLRRLDEAASGADPAAPGTDLADPLLDDEVELLLWRDEFAALGHAEQQAVLAPILQDGNPAFLRLLETAMSLQTPEVDGAIADGLSRFGTPEALPLVRELLRRPDPVVRSRAHTSLAALERQGVDIRGVFVATAESDEPVRAALATVPQGDGRMVVVVVRGHSPSRVRFAAAVVDPVEAGIANVWGESGITEGELRDRLADYAEKMELRLVAVDLPTAQGLVAEAEDYARRQGRALSSDYLVWRRCFGRPKEPVALPVVFGPVCSKCNARLRSGDLVRGGIIAGRAALCARCAAGPLACAVCGETLSRRSDGLLARQSAKGARVEFLCPRCGRLEP